MAAITANALDIRSLDNSTLGVERCIAWTPHDDNYIQDATNYPDQQVISRGISFAAAGAITYESYDGNTYVIPADHLAAGVVHPIRGIVKIKDTGTTATSISIWF